MSIIDEKLAKAFLDDPDNVDLGEATGITAGAAESLSKYKGYLDLNGLTELSDAAAESLSKHQGSKLCLFSLEELSDAAAESLSKHQGRIDLGLHLELSDAAVESLSKHEGVINEEDPKEWAELLKAERSRWKQDDSPSWDEVPEDRIVSPNEAGWIRCPDCGIKFQESTREWEDDVASHCSGHYFKRPR